MESFSAQAAEYRVQLCNEVPAEIPALFVDRGKINRVLTNLVDNALKFSPSGSRIVATARVYEGEKVLIQVLDHGPGIPEEYRERIFERFSQIPGIHARRRGTGLGLTFCRLAVEAHGGRIWVESGPSGGSAFNLTLPCNELNDK
jgi:signal transduction histidine kinase